jgi:WD40 repeat protein
MKLWDIASGKEIRTFSWWNSDSVPVRSVAFSPDGNSVLSGSGSGGVGALKLWNIASGKEIRTFSGHIGEGLSVAFSPDGKSVLSGSYDNTLKLWDIASGKEIRTFSGHLYNVEPVAFSPDGKYAISALYDGTIHLWDTTTSKEIAQFISFTDGEWVVITPDGYYNASPNGDQYLNVRIGNTVTGIDAYRSTFYNPAMVEAALSGFSN